MSTSAPTVFDEKRVAVPFTAPSPGQSGKDPIITSGELLVLDPQSIVPDRHEFDITKYVSGNGPDFGDAQITQYLADAGQIGQTPIDFKVPNRTITIPLSLQDRGIAGQSFEQVRAALQKKVGLFQALGGWIRRATPVGNVYAEIVGASLKLGGSTFQATVGVDTDAVLTLTCFPEWVGDEIQVMTTAQVFNGFGSIPMTNIHGDFPGRVRLIIQEMSANDQRGLIWGTRSHYYVPDATAKTQYEAEALTPAGTSSIASGVPGASGSVVQTTGIASSKGREFSPQWIPVLSTPIPGTGDLTHIGSYRVWARCRATTSSARTIPAVSVRISWDVGDLIVGTDNAGVPIPNTDASGNPLHSYNGWYLLDLGQVRLDKAPIGTHRWEGTIQVVSLSDTGNDENLQIDQIYIVPVDEGYGTLSTTGAGDAVLYNNQAMELRTDGAYRLAVTSDAYGPVSRVIGDLPRIPVSGLEARTVEFFIKPTQSDLTTQPDTGIDQFGVLVLYRPSYLYIAEA